MITNTERWQFRAAFDAVGDHAENTARMRALVEQFHKAFAAEFIDRASIAFFCERIDPPAGPWPDPCQCGERRPHRHVSRGMGVETLVEPLGETAK